MNLKESFPAGMISEMKEKKHINESDMLAMRLCFHKVEISKKNLKKTLDQIEQNEDKHQEKMVLRARKLSSESSTTFSKVKPKPISDHDQSESMARIISKMLNFLRSSTVWLQG